MATHSSILAWRIPWIEEPGRLQSMGVTKSQTRWKQLSTAHQNRGIKDCLRSPFRDFPGGLVVKNLPSNAGDAGSIPGWGARIPHASEQLSPPATTTCVPQLRFNAAKLIIKMFFKKKLKIRIFIKLHIFT